MFCKRTGHIFLCTSRRLTAFCVLLAAMTCGNILYWIAQWQNSGVILCSMDVFLCVLHPSFLFMIFVPFCLLTAMISSRFFYRPFLLPSVSKQKTTNCSNHDTKRDTLPAF